jgi:hypothetical protein
MGNTPSSNLSTGHFVGLGEACEFRHYWGDAIRSKLPLAAPFVWGSFWVHASPTYCDPREPAFDAGNRQRSIPWTGHGHSAGTGASRSISKSCLRHGDPQPQSQAGRTGFFVRCAAARCDEPGRESRTRHAHARFIRKGRDLISRWQPGLECDGVRGGSDVTDPALARKLVLKMRDPAGGLPRYYPGCAEGEGDGRYGRIPTSCTANYPADRKRPNGRSSNQPARAFTRR